MTQQHRTVFRVSGSMRLTALIVLTAALSGCVAFGKCGLRECTEDAKISDEVRILLAQSPALGAPNLISVQTIHGVVYLKGLVSTPYLIAEAESIAQRAPGVTEVRNLLYIDNAK